MKTNQLSRMSHGLKVSTWRRWNEGIANYWITHIQARERHVHFTHHSEDLLIELNNRGTNDGLSFFGGETSLRWKKDTPKVGILGFFFWRKLWYPKKSQHVFGRFLLRLKLSRRLVWGPIVGWGSLSTSTQMKANIPYLEQTWECEFWGEYSCGLTFIFLRHWTSFKICLMGPYNIFLENLGNLSSTQSQTLNVWYMIYVVYIRLFF